MSNSTFDREKIYNLINESFNDADFTSFCYFHFHEVNNSFADTQSKKTKIMLLLDYCDRFLKFDELLEKVKETNPAQYAIHEPYLKVITENVNTFSKTNIGRTTKAKFYKKYITIGVLFFVITAVVLVTIQFVEFGKNNIAENNDNVNDTLEQKIEDTTNIQLNEITEKDINSGNETSTSGEVVENNAALDLKVWTNKGDKPTVYQDETVIVYLQSTKTCYVRIIYEMADGTAALLVDNMQIPESKINKQIKVETEFICAEPFGNEFLNAYAQTEEFEKIETLNVSGYKIINQPLSDAYQLTEKGLKKKVEFIHKKMDMITKAK